MNNKEVSKRFDKYFLGEIVTFSEDGTIVMDEGSNFTNG